MEHLLHFPKHGDRSFERIAYCPVGLPELKLVYPASDIYSETGQFYRHQCSICKNVYASSSSLSVHQRIHTGEKPFMCQLCGKRFTQSTTLKTHERTHTGIKPYRCNICGKLFTQCGSLRSHERRHASGHIHCFQLGCKFLQTPNRLTSDVNKGPAPFPDSPTTQRGNKMYAQQNASHATTQKNAPSTATGTANLTTGDSARYGISLMDNDRRRAALNKSAFQQSLPTAIYNGRTIQKVTTTNIFLECQKSDRYIDVPPISTGKVQKYQSPSEKEIYHTISRNDANGGSHAPSVDEPLDLTSNKLVR